MRQVEGKVAVVTGAASGIGRAVAVCLSQAGMRVALADVEAEPLDTTSGELRAAGADVLAVRTDVTDCAQVEHLAQAVLDRFGRVHVLCNIAGVTAAGGPGGGNGPVWDSTVEDWQWVMGVNLMGVVHCIQVFVPLLLAHGEEGHIVTLSSSHSLSTGPGSIYAVSKHAVTRLTEGVHHDLQRAGAPIGVSLVCPSLVATELVWSERNRPAHLRNPLDASTAATRDEARRVFHEDLQRTGGNPEDIASTILNGIRDNRFYVLPHPEIKRAVRQRFEDILAERNPSPLPQ